MVAVGGATLWITGQLEAWAIVGQALAILVSLALRTRPRSWQKSPVALNVGMLLVVVGTIHVALRGEPSTVSLAHFAALTQGLQLVDARPRRSEFLLVALALFQVVLAANLTDSVFFVPLLAAFIVSTTWTLMVHTLRTEALEAGMSLAVTRAITPGLLRWTLLASGASLLLAFVLFLALPRMRSNMVRAPGFGPGFASAGFSDRVELGDIGRIRQNHSVAMRVETLRGQPPAPRESYWRGLAFDHFDGRSWSHAQETRRLVPGSPEVGISLTPGEPRANLVQRIVREPVASGVIFTPGRPEKLRSATKRVHRDANDGLYALRTAKERLRYTIESETRSPSEAELARDRTAPPARHGGDNLRLPELDAAVGELARKITEDAQTDAERVRALERHLLANGRYSDRPPRIDPKDPRSPVEIFLFGDTRGHCEYFASSMVVLARSIGIPARIVNGFAGGRANSIGGFVEITHSDAHSWVEVHYAGAGWVRYDPTPPDLRLRAAGAPTWWSRASELGSALELWWFQRVVDFDRSDQFLALRSAWQAWHSVETWTASKEPGQRLVDWRTDRASVVRLALAAASGVVLVALGLRARRRQRGATLPPQTYQRALRLLARHRGLERAETTTARDFVGRVAERVPAEAAGAFQALTEAYLAERFGGHAPSATAELTRLRAALEAAPR
jgi:transglutaminase-like putative cysteine protease